MQCDLNILKSMKFDKNVPKRSVKTRRRTMNRLVASSIEFKMISARDYLEKILITAKGLVERAKERLDKLSTFKTLMPEFFTVSDVKKEFLPLQTIV